MAWPVGCRAPRVPDPQLLIVRHRPDYDIPVDKLLLLKTIRDKRPTQRGTRGADARPRPRRQQCAL